MGPSANEGARLLARTRQGRGHLLFQSAYGTSDTSRPKAWENSAWMLRLLSLAAGKFLVQLDDARLLLFHDLLKLDNALAQVAVGYRSLMGFFSWGRQNLEKSATHNQSQDTNEPENLQGISLYAQTTTAG